MGILKVTDLNGKEIEITDLNTTIEIARLYSSFDTTNSSVEFLNIRKAYWQDLLTKLEKLQREQNDQTE